MTSIDENIAEKIIIWDYSSVANFYNSRPDYAVESISHLLSVDPKRICDIGAGTGKLTHRLTPFAEVIAVEPNENMRFIGQSVQGATWICATAEATGLPNNHFDLVTFGSSFNVCDKVLALNEAHRLLNDTGRFACLWNHRDLKDPLQQKIEEVIVDFLPNYQYGDRRDDQYGIISTVFNNTKKYIFPFVVELSSESIANAWRSHVTLKQQAGDKFESICEKIHDILPIMVSVPYYTVMWMGHK